MMACIARAQCARKLLGARGIGARIVLLGAAFSGCESPAGVASLAIDARAPSSLDASTAAGEASADHATDAGATQPSDASFQHADASSDLTGLPGLCGRPGADAVRDVFCVPGAPAKIAGLRELQAALGVNALPPEVDEAAAARIELEQFAITDDVVFLGHSTALSSRVISAINPRVLILGQRTVMAYQRGVQQVEMIGFDRDDGLLNFYLLSFRQACNDAPSGCLPGDLYTPQVERGWTAIALQDDEDLKNTPSDCRQCHQRGLASPMLLMRELRAPWTHFFAPDPDDAPYPASPGSGGRDLVRTFNQAKAGEIYAGMPSVLMSHSIGFALENFVPRDQPLEFPSLDVESELAPQMPLSGTPRRSAAWDAAYQAFKRGEQLALPYFQPNPADATKQARLIEAYRRYRAQELPAEQLPDLADVFPDDPQVRAEIGLQVEPDATPAQALIQACCQCHNDVLDQSISRARFNVALSRMSRSALDLAIARIQESPRAAGVMPPPESRQLTDAVRARLIEYLRNSTRSADDDALLDRAAALGMAQAPGPSMGGQGE